VVRGVVAGGDRLRRAGRRTIGGELFARGAEPEGPRHDEDHREGKASNDRHRASQRAYLSIGPREVNSGERSADLPHDARARGANCYPVRSSSTAPL